MFIIYDLQGGHILFCQIYHNLGVEKNIFPVCNKRAYK